MHHPASSSANPSSPAHAAKARPGCAQDIVWGRPVFRAPELPSPRAIFDPLPFRSHFSGQRLAGSH